MSIGSLPFLATGTPPSPATAARVSGGAAKGTHQASTGLFAASSSLRSEERDFGSRARGGRSFSALLDEGTRQQASSGGGGRGRPSLDFIEVGRDPDAATDSGDAGALRQDVTVAGPPPVQSRRFVVIGGAASGEAGTSDTTVNVTSNQGASAQAESEAATKLVQAQLESPIELIAQLRRTQTIQLEPVVETQRPGIETSAARAARLRAIEVVGVAESNVPPTIEKSGLQGPQIGPTARPNPESATAPTETGRQQPVALVPQVRAGDQVPLTDQPRPPAAQGRSSSEGATAQALAETPTPKQEGSVPPALHPREKPSTGDADLPQDGGQKAARPATRPDSSAEGTGRSKPQPQPGQPSVVHPPRKASDLVGTSSESGAKPNSSVRGRPTAGPLAADRAPASEGIGADSSESHRPQAVLPESLKASGPVPEATPQRPRERQVNDQDRAISDKEQAASKISSKLIPETSSQPETIAAPTLSTIRESFRALAKAVADQSQPQRRPAGNVTGPPKVVGAASGGDAKAFGQSAAETAYTIKIQSQPGVQVGLTGDDVDLSSMTRTEGSERTLSTGRPQAVEVVDYRQVPADSESTKLGIHFTQVTPRCSVGPGGGLPARPTRIRVSLCERGGLPRLSVRLALARGFPLSKVWA